VRVNDPDHLADGWREVDWRMCLSQPDIGAMQGGGFSLAGGLLGGGAAVSPVQALDTLLPLVFR
jgi:hypothetical protein